jgi:putative membrane protein
MGCAWIILLAYAQEIVRLAGIRNWARVPAAAAWMTADDLVIDPLAAGKLGYWSWHAQGFYYGVPLSNFAGWFFSGLLVYAVAGRSASAAPWSRWVGFSIALFFTLIALGQGFWLAGAIGALLCALNARLEIRAARGARQSG